MILLGELEICGFDLIVSGGGRYPKHFKGVPFGGTKQKLAICYYTSEHN